ncbi:MAG: LytTR family DNA-binding domain-containing protein [Acidobacteriota bacterium]
MTAEPIRALLVDDEALARANLRALLGDHGGWRVVGEASSGPEALRSIHRLMPDVIFLDIRMPGQGGLEVARSLGLGGEGEGSPWPVATPLVVFATAFGEHAVEAFEVEAADYLVKPIDRGRFRETVGRLERRVRERRLLEHRPPEHEGGGGGETPAAEARGPAQGLGAAPSTETFAAEAPVAAGEAPPRHVTTLAVKSVGRVRLVDVADIQWIGAAGNYVRLYLVGERCLLHRATLSSLERDLDPGLFLRIHRSTMVNRREVAELQTSIHGRPQMRLRDGTELEISQRFKPRVFAELMPD